MRRLLLDFALLLAVALVASIYPLAEVGSEWLTVRWERPNWLFGLAVVPAILYWATVGQDRRSARVKTGSVDAFQGGPIGWRARLVDLPGIVRSVALTLCLLSLAKPVSVRGPTEAEEEGIDLVVALDLSGSMRAVMDNLPADLEKFLTPSETSPVPTRLDAAKAVLRDFVARRRSDRIGVVVFGRSAYVVSPPTLDYQLLDALVSRMQLELIDPNGTAIGDALGVAVARLRKSEAKSRVIVLLTDGDNKGGELAPEYAAHLANVIGAQIYPIQVGEGDMAKVYRGSDLFGQARFESVAFPTNPALLRQIAEKTGGKAYVANDAKSLQASLHDVLDRLERTEFEAAQATYQDLFRFLLLPGVLLIFLEAVLITVLQRRFP